MLGKVTTCCCVLYWSICKNPLGGNPPPICYFFPSSFCKIVLALFCTLSFVTFPLDAFHLETFSDGRVNFATPGRQELFSTSSLIRSFVNRCLCANFIQNIQETCVWILELVSLVMFYLIFSGLISLHFVLNMSLYLFHCQLIL